MPRLDFYVDYELYTKFRLGQSEAVIGRQDTCTVQLPEERVSRVHAVIRPVSAGYEIENRSANGTRLNDHMLERAELLSPGDRIYIDKYVIVYQLDESNTASMGARTVIDPGPS